MNRSQVNQQIRDSFITGPKFLTERLGMLSQWSHQTTHKGFPVLYNYSKSNNNLHVKDYFVSSSSSFRLSLLLKV